MKRILTILFLLALINFTIAQTAQSGSFISNKTPQYMASGSSARLPVVFEANIVGLMPSTTYFYYTKAMAFKDIGTSSHGAGNTLILEKNGKWKHISSGSFSGSNFDSFKTSPGGDYNGYFGLSQTGNSRFSNGKYIYPVLVLQNTFTKNKSAFYLNDSIKCLSFGTAKTNGTAIYGNSFAKGQDIVALFDKSGSFGARPISMTYVEKSKLTLYKPASFYKTNVENKIGSWGTIIPNDLANGIKTIERYGSKDGNFLYGNNSSTAKWEGVDTKNPKGGSTAIKISQLAAPLEKTTVAFDKKVQTISESNTTINLNVTISAAFADSSIVYITHGGAALVGKDYSATIDTLVFYKNGPYTKVYSFKILDDKLQELTENVSLKLQAIKGTSIGDINVHTLFITDNDTSFIGFDKKTETILEDAVEYKIPAKVFNGSSLPSGARLYIKSFSGGTIIPQEFSLGASNIDSVLLFDANVSDSVILIKSDIYNDATIESPDSIVFSFKDLNGISMGNDSLFTLIILDDDQPQVFNFTETAKSLHENQGKYRINVRRTKYTSKLADVKVRYVSNTTAKEGSDFNYKPQSKILNFSKTSGDDLFAEIEIIDDEDFEMDEEIILVLEPLVNAKIGSMDTLRITIINDDLPIHKLSTVSTLDANGVADSLGVKCRVTGLVYGGNLHPHPSSSTGLLFTLNDNTSGIKVFSPNGVFGYAVKQGDSIMVQGVITQTNGELMLNNLDTIKVLKTNVAINLPKEITELVEMDESSLVKFSKVKLKDKNEWPTTMGNNQVKNVTIITEKGEATLRIDSDTDVDLLTAPASYFSLTGIVGQNDASNPYNSDYHIVPRKKSDISNINVPVVLFKNATISTNEKLNKIDVELSITNPSDDAVVEVIDNGAGSAKKPLDYIFASPKIIDIKKGEASKTFSVDLKDEVVKDGTKTIVLELKAGFGSELGATPKTTITIIDNETGLSDLPNWLSSVSPNPAVDLINVNAKQKLISISLIDVNGKKVLDFNPKNTQLNISQIATGVYWLSIQSDKGIAIVKIIKQ